VALLGQGQADSAAVLFREAMKLRGDPPREAAAYNLGNISMRTKDYAGAARSYKEALRISPSDPDAKRNLEEALRRMRRPSPSDRPNPPSGSQGPPNSGAGRPRQAPSRAGKGETPPPRGGTGAFTKEEAERWLQSLESERRAQRQEGKGHPEEETGNRDW
jgi:tetratricopeptide (TPR) repeat protein